MNSKQVNYNQLKQKRTTIFLNPELYKKLKICAIELNKTVGDCMNEAVFDFLKKQKKLK